MALRETNEEALIALSRAKDGLRDRCNSNGTQLYTCNETSRVEAMGTGDGKDVTKRKTRGATRTRQRLTLDFHTPRKNKGNERR